MMSLLSARGHLLSVSVALLLVAEYVFSTQCEMGEQWLITFSYTFHSNSHGFSCDMVENWEIVLADGSVVNANSKDNADLWKAQKGASGNLGFVTRIDQRKQFHIF